MLRMVGSSQFQAFRAFRGRLLFVLAGLLYLAAAGCGVWSDSNSKPAGKPADTEPTATHVPFKPNLEGLPYRGAALQIQYVNRIDDYKKSIDSIAADGFDTI